MERIVLYREERSDIKICMEMYFNVKGQLILEGINAYSKFGDFILPEHK